jgi:hypothetical protein
VDHPINILNDTFSSSFHPIKGRLECCVYLRPSLRGNFDVESRGASWRPHVTGVHGACVWGSSADGRAMRILSIHACRDARGAKRVARLSVSEIARSVPLTRRPNDECDRGWMASSLVAKEQSRLSRKSWHQGLWSILGRSRCWALGTPCNAVSDRVPRREGDVSAAKRSSSTHHNTLAWKSVDVRP